MENGENKDGSFRRTDATIAPASTPEAAANIKPSFNESVSFAQAECNEDQKNTRFEFSENAGDGVHSEKGGLTGSLSATRWSSRFQAIIGVGSKW